MQRQRAAHLRTALLGRENLALKESAPATHQSLIAFPSLRSTEEPPTDKEDVVRIVPSSKIFGLVEGSKAEHQEPEVSKVLFVPSRECPMPTAKQRLSMQRPIELGGSLLTMEDFQD